MSETSPREYPLEATPLSPEEAAAFEARKQAGEAETSEHITPEEVQELAEHIATIDALEEALKALDEQEDN